MKRDFQERQNRIHRHVALAAPVIADLKAAGYDVASLDDLRRSGRRYRSAVPILLFWLSRINDPDVRESIIRCLSVPWAKGIATRPVLEDFFRAPEDNADPASWQSLRWAVGNAMEVIADESVEADILAIVRNPQYGTARQMFVLALAKIKPPPEETAKVLLQLLEDDEVCGHAAIAAGKIGIVEAAPRLRVLLGHRQAWIRREAKRALARIEGPAAGTTIE